MMFPFNPDKLKSAGYEAKIGKNIWYWDDDEKRHDEELNENDNICFRKNSITYISLKETFIIPDYIALRFNLTIKHVHRGILLGTGPLIDPGFRGKIMIPIHNLTPNNYMVRPGDDIVCIEFTKLSPNSRWVPAKNKENGSYVKNKMISFPTFLDYFNKALPYNINSVRSSIGTVIHDAESKFNSAIGKAELKYKRATTVMWSVVVTALVGLAPLFYYTWQSYNSTQNVVNDAHQFIIESNSKFDDTINDKISSIVEDKIKAAKEDLKRRDASIEKRIDQFEDLTNSQMNSISEDYTNRIEKIKEENNSLREQIALTQKRLNQQ